MLQSRAASRQELTEEPSSRFPPKRHAPTQTVRKAVPHLSMRLHSGKIKGRFHHSRHRSGLREARPRNRGEPRVAASTAVVTVWTIRSERAVSERARCVGRGDPMCGGGTGGGGLTPGGAQSLVHRASIERSTRTREGRIHARYLRPCRARQTGRRSEGGRETRRRVTRESRCDHSVARAVTWTSGAGTESAHHSRSNCGGGGGNRTRVQGFADPCLSHSATPPRRTSQRTGRLIVPGGPLHPATDREGDKIPRG